VNFFDANGEAIPLIIIGVIKIGGVVVARIAVRRGATVLARQAALRRAQQEARRRMREIVECDTIWRAYHELESRCSACNGCMKCSEVRKNVACWTGAAVGRRKYLAKRCDYILPGSIRFGSREKERTHRLQLATTVATAAKCTVALSTCVN
jgi:hypothetical protein